MEKENGDNSGVNSKNSGGGGGGGGNDVDQNLLLDAASLFAYWGRDGNAAAAANPLFGSPFGAAAAAAGLGMLPSGGGGGGGGSGNNGNGNSGNNADRYSMSHPHHQTMAVAASQAASLAGLHPASWWSMAQLAAQDYFSRLQASGLSQMPFSHPDLAAAFPSSLSMGGVNNSGTGSGGGGSSASNSGGQSSRTGGESKNNSKNRRDKKSSNNIGMSGNNIGGGNMGGGGGGGGGGGSGRSSSSYKEKSKGQSSSSSSLSASQSAAAAAAAQQAAAYKSSLYNPVALHKELLAMQAAAQAAQAAANSTQSLPSSTSLSLSTSTSSSKKSNSGSNSHLSSSSHGLTSPSMSASSYSKSSQQQQLQQHHQQQQQQQQQQHHQRQQQHRNSDSGGGSNNNNNNSNNTNSGQNQNNSSSSTSNSGHHHHHHHHDQHNQLNTKETGKNSSSSGLGSNTNSSISMSALTSLSQLGNLNLTSQQSVTAAMNALAASNSSNKAKDYMPSGILSAALEGSLNSSSDPSSILGVRLPPDTEIIKYTSSIVGPKIPGTTNRGRKKTISLDPNPLLGLMGHGLSGLSAAKRARLEAEYPNLQTAHQNDRVEVIKLPPTITSNGVYNFSKTGANLSMKELNQDTTNEWAGLNLSAKSTSSLTNSDNDSDAPLNLSMKTESTKTTPNDLTITSSSGQILSSTGNLTSTTTTTSSKTLNSAGTSNSLQSLSSITAAVGSNNNNNNNTNNNNNSNNNSNNNNNNSSSSGGSGERSNSGDRLLHYKEGRPRNLGRGVSKPKKNTVASLLAQSRAVGIKPMLTTQQLLSQGADLEKIRQVITEAAAAAAAANQSEIPTDTESVTTESGLSESEGEEQINLNELRLPLDNGWKRETIIRGLTKNGQIRGDVYYYSPGSTIKLKHITQIQVLLEQQQHSKVNLTRDNFSFSPRAIVGTFLQPPTPPYATDGDYLRMTDTEVSRRLEDLKLFTRHATLGVEQRIEIARHQQAIRDAKKLAKEELARSKEKARQAKEQEKNERLEAQRKERELRNQQALEARRKRQEELEKQKQEEIQRKQQEKELKRQQALLIKEQIYLQELNKQKELLYTVELERERRRQHMALVKQLDIRRKYEDREKRKHQIILDKLITREKKLAARKRDSEILTELRKPHEDSELSDQKCLPDIDRIDGLKLSGQGLADLLMVFEFLHNFGETLGFDMESLPTLQSLHQALVSDNAVEAEEELLSVMTHLLVCAIEDPGIPNPGRHTTLLGQSLRQADITNSNISEILRIYLYAVATGEIRLLTGVNFERDRERRVADHHQTDPDVAHNSGKNSQYYEHLHENTTWKLSECLKDKPFVALNPTVKAQILAHLCNDLLLNKAVVRQIEGSLESQAQLKKDRYLLENKVRKYKSMHARKVRYEQFERSQQLALEKSIALKQQIAESEIVDITADSDTKPSETSENNDQTMGESNANDTGALTDAAGDIDKNDNDLETKMQISGESSLIDNINDTATDHLINHKDDSLLSNDISAIKTNVEDISIKNLSEQKQKDIKTLTAAASITTTSGLINATTGTINSVATGGVGENFNFSEINNSTVNLNDTTGATDINSLLNKSIITKNNITRDINDATASAEVIDDEISDVESEETMAEEDEERSTTSDEIHKKLERIIKASNQNIKLLDQTSNQLRAKSFGQDRFWRRFWHLPKAGGIYAEALESAQPDIYKYHSVLEEQNELKLAANRVEMPVTIEDTHNAENDEVDDEEEEEDNDDEDEDAVGNDNENDNEDVGESSDRKRKLSTAESSEEDDEDDEEEEEEEETCANGDDNNDLANIKTELNLSDHTQITKYETSTNPDENKLEETCVQLPKITNDDHIMDIEDSIPTAVLVQKTNCAKDEIKLIDTIKCDDSNNDIMETTENLIDGNKPPVKDEDTNDVCDIKPKLENGEIINEEAIVEPTNNNVILIDDSKPELKVEKMEIKDEDDDVIKIDDDDKDEDNKNNPLIDKWFSIINKEVQLASLEYPGSITSHLPYANLTCECLLQTQGNRWDIGNNIQYFNIPVEASLNDGQFITESILSASGLDEQLIDMVLKNTKCKCNNDTVVDGESDMEIDGIDSFEMKSYRNMNKQLLPRQEDMVMTGITLPAFLNVSFNNLNTYIQCDSPSPLQMTQDEQKLLDDVKANGLPKRVDKNFVSKDLRHGWWKINNIEILNNLIDALHMRGVRERELRLNLLNALREHIDFSTPHEIGHPDIPGSVNGYTEPENMSVWNPAIARRVEVSLMEQVEAMEDKIASASMQVKGWALPQRDTDLDNGAEERGSIDVLRERILGLEAAIERRYLKPPLGNSTGDAHLAALAQNQDTCITGTESRQQHNSLLNSNASGNGNGGSTPTSTANDNESIPKGLVQWREAVSRSHTAAQLAMALYVLESCVAWDKSIMKAPINKIKKDGSNSTQQRSFQNCQFCHSGESEDKLLLCDGCDKGYHTYCFKPKMEKIPEGDWYCYECVNKATNERKCIVCGGHRMPPVGKMILCELCPRAYHHDCYIPPLLKVPRGKWYCHGCISKAPPPKKRPRKNKEIKQHNSSQSLNSSHDELMPLSPAHSVASTSYDEHPTVDTKFNTNAVINSVAQQTPQQIQQLQAAVTTNIPIVNPIIGSPTTSEMYESSLDGMNNSGTNLMPTIPSAINASTPIIHSNVATVVTTPSVVPMAAVVTPIIPTTPVTNNDAAVKEKLKQEKKEKHSAKRLMKELAVCKIMLEEMELHEDSWPFLLPVNTKQFPTYKKIIKLPMDFSTIKKRLQEIIYKSRDDFVNDVRQIFDNCEVFNEDDSPVGKAGHGMRKFFEMRWSELTDKQHS